MTSLEKVRVLVPVFATVTYCTLLVLPTLMLPKLSEVEESERTGPLLGGAGAGAIATLALADLVLSATLVAVTVALPPEGTLAGAV